MSPNNSKPTHPTLHFLPPFISSFSLFPPSTAASFYRPSASSAGAAAAPSSSPPRARRRRRASEPGGCVDGLLFLRPSLLRSLARGRGAARHGRRAKFGEAARSAGPASQPASFRHLGFFKVFLLRYSASLFHLVASIPSSFPPPPLRSSSIPPGLLLSGTSCGVDWRFIRIGIGFVSSD